MVRPSPKEGLQMSLTALNWPLIVSLIAISALFLCQPRSRDSRGDQPNLPIGKVRLEDIEVRLMSGKIDEANASRHTPPPLPRASNWAFGQNFRGLVWISIAPVVVFLVVACVGAATSYFARGLSSNGSEHVLSLASSDPDSEMLSNLADFAGSLGAHAAPVAANELLPDVSTMIERLEARLKTAPNDVKGWQMLGWSHFNTGRFEQAAAAYAKALVLDPSSAELKLAYGEAKAKASVSGDLKTASSLPTGTSDRSNDAPKAATVASMPASERNAAIRSMVDRLAGRLERSPRDVEGWARLMRSRVVLGERAVAATALRKALEVFKDDDAASGKIAAVATELGLQPK
jgi:cytochrome c-type biogenesis protein CcmH